MQRTISFPGLPQDFIIQDNGDDAPLCDFFGINVDQMDPEFQRISTIAQSHIRAQQANQNDPAAPNLENRVQMIQDRLLEQQNLVQMQGMILQQEQQRREQELLLLQQQPQPLIGKTYSRGGPGVYLCMKCKQPKKGHECPLENVEVPPAKKQKTKNNNNNDDKGIDKGIQWEEIPTGIIRYITISIA
jgi:hypothetical protein